MIDMLDEDETIELYFWKTSISQDEYEKELLELGFDEKVFGDEEVFQSEIVDNLGIFNEKNRIGEIRKEYKKARLEAIKNVTVENNSKFLKDYEIEDKDVIYFSNYTSTLIINVSKKDLLRIVDDDRVLGISLYEDIEIKNQLFITLNQVNAGYGTTQNPGLKNTSQGGYDGTGVTIGIIEAENGRFDPNAPQLSSMVSSGQLEFIEVSGVNEVVHNHATHVTNIIAGQSYTFSETKYEGIATGAQIYQSAIDVIADYYTAFNQFATLGVDVINSSLGGVTNGYSAFDQEVDNLIYTTKIILVNASGNLSFANLDRNVMSPGKAYNAITVGNTAIKSDTTTAENSPYDMSWSTCYQVNDYLSNKPEITAPGENISSVNSNGIYTSSGTSFAAPHVTGVVAQLIEKYGSTVNTNNYITYYKGRLMLGSNSAIVDDDSHRSGDSPIFYNEQGAGMLDAKNSAKGIYGWNKYLKLNSLSLNYYNYIFTPPMDYTIKAILIFEKPENAGISSEYGNDFNLYLQSPGGTIYKSSTSSTNVHEMLKYTISANQEVLLRVNRASYISSSLYISISCFWVGV